MTRDFDLVRASFAASRPARACASIRRITVAAWRTSSFRAAIHGTAGHWPRLPAPALIRTVAITLAVAAAMQPLLMWMMPLAVRPALPWQFFAAIAVLLALAAWRPDVIANAWPTSRVGRWLRG